MLPASVEAPDQHAQEGFLDLRQIAEGQIAVVELVVEQLGHDQFVHELLEARGAGRFQRAAQTAIKGDLGAAYGIDDHAG